MAESGFVKVAGVGELSPGQMKSVDVGDEQVLLANVAGTIYACDNLCTHALAPWLTGTWTASRSSAHCMARFLT